MHDTCTTTGGVGLPPVPGDERPVVAVAESLDDAAIALGMAPGLVAGRLCPRCGSDRHGRPVVQGRPDLEVSLSRSAGTSVVALARGVRVGVDVEAGDLEAGDADRYAGVRDVLLHPAEHADSPAELAITWVRKEALLKAVGTGLATDPRAVRLSPASASPEVLAWPSAPATTPVTLVDLDLAPGVVGCLAMLCAEEPELRLLVGARAAPSRRARPARGE